MLNETGMVYWLLKGEFEWPDVTVSTMDVSTSRL